MKKYISAVIALLLTLSCFSTTAFAGDCQLNIDKSNISNQISPMLYGIRLNSSDFACDGGLVAQLVCNNSFEYADNSIYAWHFDNLAVSDSTDSPISTTNPTYQTITVQGKGVARNLGYCEINSEASALVADMGFKAEEKYDFSCYLKNIDFNGTISVFFDSKSNSKNVYQLDTSTLSKNKWTKLSTTLTALSTQDGALAIEFNGSGSVMLDFVTLVPQNSYGYNTQGWKYVSLNTQLVDSIKNLNSPYIYFGASSSGSSFNWKDTIGPLQNRKQSADATSNFMGYHECLQLCEELGSIAVPTVSIPSAITVGSVEFSNYVQDVLDLVEYAKGDANSSYWGSMRSQNAHQSPYDLQYIALVGEASNQYFEANYDAVYSALKSKYSDLTIISQTDEYSYQNNVGSAAEQGVYLASLEQSNNESSLSVCSTTIAKINANLTQNSLLWYDSQQIVYTPNYYVQMLFANNMGTQYVQTTQIGQGISQSVTIDQAKQIVYIKLVNTQAKQKITVNLNGFDSVTAATNFSISSSFKSAGNELNKNYIAPKVANLQIANNGFVVEAEKNSVNVICVAYGDSTASAIYTLPDNIDYNTDMYTPKGFKLAVILSAALVTLVIIGGYVFAKKMGLIKAFKQKAGSLNNK